MTLSRYVSRWTTGEQRIFMTLLYFMSMQGKSLCKIPLLDSDLCKLLLFEQGFNCDFIKKSTVFREKYQMLCFVIDVSISRKQIFLDMIADFLKSSSIYSLSNLKISLI